AHLRGQIPHFTQQLAHSAGETRIMLDEQNLQIFLWHSQLVELDKATGFEKLANPNHARVSFPWQDTPDTPLLNLLRLDRYLEYLLWLTRWRKLRPSLRSWHLSSARAALRIGPLPCNRSRPASGKALIPELKPILTS